MRAAQCVQGTGAGLAVLRVVTLIAFWLQVKAFLADPSAFSVEAAPEAGAGGGGGDAAEAKEEAKKEEEPEEEEEEEDMGFSLFD